MYDNDAAVFGVGLSVVYVAFLMLCFMKEVPPSLKEVPIIGKYGKLMIWLGFVGTAAWYARPSGGHAESVGFLLVGVMLLGFATAAAESGAEERNIMAMTGHKTTQMVRRYIQEANLFKNNALNKIKF